MTRTENGVAGLEIAAHRQEIEQIVRAIMCEHGARCEAQGEPCEWIPDDSEALAMILRDHAEALCEILECYHVRVKKEAA